MISLVTGGCYKATVKLGFFEQAAGNGTIEAKLLDAGFTHVTVTGSGRTRFASGVWMGENRTVDPSDLDEHLSSVEHVT